MSLYKDLLSYKRKSLYKSAKTRKDSRLNVGNDYQSNGLLPNMLSKHIQRNPKTIVSQKIRTMTSLNSETVPGHQRIPPKNRQSRPQDPEGTPQHLK